MSRRPAVLWVGVMTLVVACGQTSATASGGPSGSGSPSGAAGRGPRNGASGELVQLGADTLVLSGPNGDSTVRVTTNTTYVRTSTGTVADIAPGACIAASGSRDSSGALAVASVRVSSPVSGSCPTPAAPRALPSGSPLGAPRQGGERSSLRGEVTAVAGTAVTVAVTGGQPTVINVPTTVRVGKTTLVTASDLVVGTCLLAVGPRSASGVVTARAISIVPAGPSGCASGGGRRGFGGGPPGGAVTPGSAVVPPSVNSALS